MAEIFADGHLLFISGEWRDDNGDAVEIERIRHGRWIEWWPPKHMILTGEEMLYRCSACDAKYSDKENMRFCPNCGATMDKADDED